MAPRTRCPVLLAWVLLILAGGWLAGCKPSKAPRALELVSFAQGRADRVFLNETLDFRFSEPLDPTSIHPGSAQVVDAAGTRVSGTWSSDRRSLSFMPDLPRSPELEDSGFAPGRTYSVTLLGFPRLDGLRTRRGEPLAKTLRFTFRTVEEEGGGALFVDEFFGPPYPLTIERAMFEADRPILMNAYEPLDPRSVQGADFGLYQFNAPRGDQERADDPDPGARTGLLILELRAQLRENTREGAVVELWPLEGGIDSPRRVLEEGEYLLVCRQTPTSLLELGGHPVPAGFGSTPVDGAYLTVTRPNTGGRDVSSSRWVEIDFVQQRDLSEATPPDADGTALWVGDGLLTARYPASAGLGGDGPVELPDGTWSKAVTEATELRLGAEAVCQLEGDGLVRVSSQGALRVEGRLTRRVRVGPTAIQPEESAEDWILRLRQAALDQEIMPVPEFAGQLEGRATSSWLDVLEAAELSGQPWTVLVAGGDLTVSGEIFVDGPLLLVAGGWVRISGQVVASEIWTTEPRRGQRSLPPAEKLPFELSHPASNPLRRPLRWSILSRPLPLSGPFGPAELLQLAGDGRAGVRFTGESTGLDGSRQRVGPVDDPSLLFDASALSFRIDLDMPAAHDKRATGFQLPRVDALRFQAQRANSPERVGTGFGEGGR